MAEYKDPNALGYKDSNRTQSIQEPQGSGRYRTQSIQFKSDHRHVTPELKPEEPSEEMELAVAVLMNIIEVHDSYILVFIRNEECSSSQEILAMIREVTDIHIETYNLAEMERNFKGFHQALKGSITIDSPPLVFNNGKYVGNHSTFLKAYRFQRVDIVLEPPEYPWYHVIVIGSSHGAQMIVEELKRNKSDLKIALVKVPSPLPQKLHSNNLRRMARYRIWNNINNLIGSSNDPTTFWSQSTYDNLKETDDLMTHCIHGNVDFCSGIVQFLSKDTIKVYPTSDENSSMGLAEDEDEMPINLLGMNYILCTGCLPKFEPFPGIEYTSSLQNFISRGVIPQSSLIIGNTPEVLETAHLLALDGGEVTIMTLSKRWLPMIDQRYVQQIIHSFRKRAVAFVMIRKVIGIRVINKDKLQVKFMVRDTKKCLTEYYSEVVLDYPTIPATLTMDLEQAEVVLDKEGKLEVNDVYQTSNPSIYAFGSIVRGHPTCPKFEMLAGLKTIRFITRRGMDDVQIPNIFPTLVRTPLEFASVGATKKTVELKDCEMLVINKSQNPFFNIQLICTRTKNWSGELYMKKNDQVKGVHILGYDVCCLIAGVDTLIDNGLTKGTLVDIMTKSSLFKKLPINRISFTSRKYFKDMEHRRNYMDNNRDSDAEDSDASSIYVESWKTPHASEISDMDENDDETEWIEEDVPLNSSAVSIDWRNCDKQIILNEIINMFAWVMITNIIAISFELYSASEHGASIEFNNTGGKLSTLILSPYASSEHLQHNDDRSLSVYEEDGINISNYQAQVKRRNSCPNFGEDEKLKCAIRSYSYCTLGTVLTAKRFLNKSEADDSNLNQENSELVPKEIYYILLLVTTTVIIINAHVTLFRHRITSPSAELTEGDLNLIVLLDNDGETEVSEIDNLYRENSEYLLQELHSAILMVTSLVMLNMCITSFRHRIKSPSAEITEGDLNLIEFFENSRKVTRNEFFDSHEDQEEQSPVEQAVLTSVRQRTRRSKRVFELLSSKCSGKKRSCVIL